MQEAAKYLVASCIYNKLQPPVYQYQIIKATILTVAFTSSNPIGVWLTSFLF